jgi:hypothetical protein
MIGKLKELFKPKTDYKKLYEEERKNSQKWEFKFNKLKRQLNAILIEAKL